MFYDRGIRLPARSVILFVGDILCIALSIVLAAFLRLGIEHGLEYIEDNQVALVASCAIFLLVFYVGGMYERRVLSQKIGDVLPYVLTVSIGLVLIILMFYARFELLIGRGVLFLAAFFVGITSWGLRYFYRMVAGYGLFSKNALIVGDGKDAASVIRLLKQMADPGHKLFGVVSHVKSKPGEFLEGVPILGHTDKLREFVVHYRIETLIIATTLAREHALLRVLRPLRYAGVEILDYASFYETLAQEIPIDHIDDEWLMHAAMNSSRIHIRNIKRIMDVMTSVVGLILSAPIVLLAAIAIKLDSPGPVLYRQRRAGLDGNVYTLIKLRTMKVDAEVGSGAVWAGKFDHRVTRIGHFLRKSRIDEIPQLVNVLAGDMSLVGPRPERPEFIEALANAIPYYKERLLVPPGITGWAQINYPYAASVDAARRKLQYDLYYIKHMSLFLDTMILLRTFKTILVGLRHSEEDDEAVSDPAPRQLTVLRGSSSESRNSKTA